MMLIATLLISGAELAARAAVDLACGANATSAVAGTVRDADGAVRPGIGLELRQSNKETPIVAAATTNASGFYRLCAGHDTYDVRATDPSGLFATAGRSVSTFTSPQSSADFTIQYKLNLKISPQAVSIPAAGNARTVTWTVRSKAPSATAMRLTLEHLGPSAVTMPFSAAEAGGPGAGGWNVWTYSATLSNPAQSEGVFFATVYGANTASNRQITELAKDPYFVDNHAPVFGPSTLSGQPISCGNNTTAIGFSPDQTTNPMALISIGVCDMGPSSLNTYSVSVQITDPANQPVTAGTVFLNQLRVQYLPSASQPLQPGTYTFRFTISDNAGNATTSAPYLLNVTTYGGSVPVISGVQPSNLGENANSVVIGSQFTTPLSIPVIAFLATDADGQLDLNAGALHVRVYGPDGSTLVYDYDARTTPCAISEPGDCPPNTGFFNQGTGRFEASGFTLQGKTPGLYVVSASITDHGGNAATRTWRFLLAAAI